MNEIKIGDKFGHWTVIDNKIYKIHRKNYDIDGFLCECDCHNKTQKVVDKYGLLSKHSTSCGCTRRTTHGMSHTKFYRQYQGMIRRCYDPKFKEYSNYGARGVKVCEEWKDGFENFYNWATDNGFKEGLTIDRIDVNGNYEPNNCQWIPLKEQMSNKRNNIYLEFNGEKLTLVEWSKKENINVSYNTLLKRYHSGWNVEDILFKEVK